MNIHELDQRLAEEGCNPSFYSVGSRGGASDAFCLTRNNGKWRVFYTERGQDHAPIFETHSEEDACRFFFRHIMAMRHDHCVGFFRSEQQAKALGAKLEQHGLNPHRDKIPYGGPRDPRYRVFVTGKAIFKAKEILGAVPVQD